MQDEPSRKGAVDMKPLRIVVILVVVLLAAGAAYYFWPVNPPPPPPPAAVEAPPPLPAAEPPTHYPIEEQPAAEPRPLPTLKESDPALRDGISALVGAQAFIRFFNAEEIVRRIVATVDNLPRRRFAQRLSPVKPVGGLLLTTGGEGSVAIAPENAARYAPYVSLVEAIDAKKVVALYVHFYPLFQQAYVDLGYPNGYFNDRLVQVIDNLLATPDVQGPIRLVVPHVLYQYEDPQLEGRSSGQKLLLRMGSANGGKVKAKLRELRAAIVHSPAATH
jgi:hypothetical protein